MNKKIFYFVFLLSAFISLDVFSLSLLPFDQDKEKQRFIFRTLTNIERRPVWLLWSNVEDNVFVEDKIEQTYGITAVEIEQAIDLSFIERGIDPADWIFDWNEYPASANLSTLLTFDEKMVVIDLGLYSEAVLLESKVLVTGILWKKRLLVNLEGKELCVKDEIAMRLKTLIGDFLDDYIHALSDPSKPGESKL